MPGKAILIFLQVCFVCAAVAAEVKFIQWPTRHASPPADLDEGQKGILPLIRLGVTALPESTVMQMTFFGGTALGLPVDQSQSLHDLLSDRYQVISEDKTFSRVPSALGYCFSAEKPKQGRASVYLPDAPNPDSKVLLFLHGFGGSFVFYQHYLADVFPDHIIVYPAYGISTASISGLYLRECMETVSKQVGFNPKKPVLMGLSAGGFGGFREYASNADSYGGFICMAAYPPSDVVAKLPRNSRIRLVAGGDEYFVKDGSLQKTSVGIKRRISDFSMQVIPGHDHFFMLSAEKETKTLLKKWVTELQGE